MTLVYKLCLYSYFSLLRVAMELEHYGCVDTINIILNFYVMDYTPT